MFPLAALLISGLLSAASAGANSMRQGKIDNARKDAMNAERIRQKAYDQEATAFNTQSQDRFKDYGTEQTAKGKSLGDYFAKASAPTEDANADAGALMPTSSSDIVTREIGKQDANAGAFVGKQAAALGDLRAFGDLLGEKSTLQARDAGSIGQVGGFKKGSSAVLPYELEAANQKGAGLGILADLLGGAGSVVSSAGSGGLGSMFGGTPGLTKAQGVQGAAASLFQPRKRSTGPLLL